MIEQTSNTSAALGAHNAPARKILTMVKNERMGGYVPKYSKPETAHQQVEQNLGLAAHGIDPTSQSFESALAYSAENAAHPLTTQDDFSFGDLIDMVNPLHHIPVVGTVYRGITGDEIKPIGQIIGGALFGGPIGAASGLINTVVEAETGHDIAGNAMAFVIDGEKPHFKTSPNAAPEQRLEQASKIIEAKEDLPASLLSFTNSGANAAEYRAETFAHYKNLHRGSMNRLSGLDTMPTLPARENITKLAALDMPAKL